DDVLRRVWPGGHKSYRRLLRGSWGSIAHGIPGDKMVLMRLPWKGGDVPFAVLICSENTYPPVPAEAGGLRARLFLNLQSEGNMGGPVQEQLLRISMLRAIENRIAYVRDGNTGISCFVDARGRLRALLRGPTGQTIMEPGVLVHRVPLSTGGVTLYARSHDAFAKVCVAFAGARMAWTLSWARASARPSSAIRAEREQPT